MHFIEIFIVDDDPEITEMLSYQLEKEGLKTQCFSNVNDALNQIKRTPPDVIVTDWMMPENDGLDFAKKLKFNPETEHIPMIMMSAKSDESDVVTSLEFGFDDYLTKPFRLKEFVARVKRVVKRKKEMMDELETKQGNTKKYNIVIGALTINSSEYSAYIGEEKLVLTLTEFKLLELLASKPGRVFTRSEIIEKINGMDYYVTERSVDVQMVNLRKRLGKYKDYIVTVRSVGYSFKNM